MSNFRHSTITANHNSCTAAELAPINNTSSFAVDEHSDARLLDEVASRFSVAITAPMQDLIDTHNSADPIALQFMPDVRELREEQHESADPIGDATHSPVPGIIHRYPDRLLLTPIRVCPVYCRFCFRRETVGQQENALLDQAQLDSALDYIRDHQEVWEVILSGGDPLLLSARRLQYIFAALDAIEHVRVIRIHTRVPVVDPERITTELIAALKQTSPVYVVLHSNHPRELTTAAKFACAQLVDNGIPMLSQTVLLKDVNDNVHTLEQLFRGLVENRIKPYYLHHADRARGTGHFRTSVKTGQQLMQQLRGRVSGLCQPDYVLDIPGGHGKVPIGPAWIETAGEHSYTVSDYRQTSHRYHDSDD